MNGQPRSSVLSVADLLLGAVGLIATRHPGAIVLGLLAFRLAAVLGALANEWAHVAVALVHGAGARAWHRRNLTGHVSLRAHARACVPFALDGRGDLYVEIPGLPPTVAGRVRVFGFWLSAAGTLFAAATAVIGGAGSAWAFVAWAGALGGLVSVTASFATDLAARSPYRGHPTRMACGNLTLLGRLLPGESAAVPPRVGALLASMLHVTQLRGAQSGGGAVKVAVRGHPRQIIQKCVKAKRAGIAAPLTRLLQGAGKARAAGASFVVQAHLRFATSGLASRDESHPFRFVEVGQRGPRRVFRPEVLETAPVVRPVETAITHNGDLDALTFRGVRIAHPDLGFFLERVLGTENRWVGDSPSLAGALELFLTRGLWLEAIRLAYLEVIAPPPPELSSLGAARSRTAHADAVREVLRDYPLPSMADYGALAQHAEIVWLETHPSPRARFSERDSLAERLCERWLVAEMLDVDRALLVAFARRALDHFLDDDLFRAARQIESMVEGTFGCVLSSTLEPDVVVAFARGQPLSLGVKSDTGMVAIVSERNALRVRGEDGVIAFDSRLDFDLTNAEIARIATGDVLQPQLSLYCVAERRSYTMDELARSGRFVSLLDNDLTPPLPVEANDRVRQDLTELPAILRAVRFDFSDRRSRNRRSAETLAYALLAPARPRLLVLGITNDLWVAEQFAANLKLCIRDLDVQAMSSNQFLKESIIDTIEPGTVVLAVSQSGQDFPTLAALYQVRQHFGEAGHGRLFVLTGEADTLMGQAVGQSYAPRALWLGRILTNCAGYRPSEAATASVNATHAALCELLYIICETAREGAPRHHGLVLSAAECDIVRERGDVCINSHVDAILSGDTNSARAPEIARRIGETGRRFGGNVIEGIAAFGLACLVLEANLAVGLKIKPSWLAELVPENAPRLLAHIVAGLSAQADVLYYLFLTPLFVWLLRLLQGRARLHRQGPRELLFGDTGYVRRIVWLFTRKLFSLSYGFATVKPYAADNQDDLIMTHEPVRGTLAIFGVPDGRRQHLGGHEAAAWMTATQFASSRSLGGAGAEVVTIGHEPTGAVGFAHLALPSADVVPRSRTVDMLIEGMYDSWERLLAMQALIAAVAEVVSRPLPFDSSRTKDQVFAPTTASPVSAGFLGRGGLVKETFRFTRVSMPFEIVARRTRLTATVAMPPPALSRTESGTVAPTSDGKRLD